MNSAYSITSKFQVTIPKKLRDELRLKDSDRVSFERRGQEIVIKKVPTLKEISNILQADLKRRGVHEKVTQKDINGAHGKFIREKMTW